MLRLIYGTLHAVIAAVFLFLSLYVFIVRADHWQILQVYFLTMALSAASAMGFFRKKKLLAALPPLPLFLVSLIWIGLCVYGALWLGSYSAQTAFLLALAGAAGCAFEASSFFVAVKTIE